MSPVSIIVRAIIVHKNAILLCSVKGSGYYFLPGGHVESGENSVSAIKRELREDVGGIVKDIKHIGVFECEFLRKNVENHEINLLFHISLYSYDITCLEDHIEYTWMSLDDFASCVMLPSSLHSHIMQWLKDNEPFFGIESYGKHLFQ